MSCKSLKGLILFFESDNALASDVFITAYKVLPYNNNLFRNFLEFKDDEWTELVQRLALELTKLLCLNQNGAYFALAYSITPCGALNLTM
ncbi:MAG: hypothetical protein EZS28_004663 [Streblomastix strix]|uniref:Uncharacterized protein n=1 Tax=Streblomastix strix TaxID=222440 RepID=A0A5J4X031_9EUKA|nr:MAG: hypothetical protein EZS28_004663 [Streblomastix strix]